MNVYYKVITVWCDYPFNDVVDYKYIEFYTKTKSKGSKRYKKIEGTPFEKNTTLVTKMPFLKEKLKQSKITLIKLKF